MIHLDNIHSLSDFQRNTKDHIRRLKKSRRPEVLTINGQAALVVQSAEAYQKLLDKAQFTGHIQALRKSLAEAGANRGRPVRAAIEELARQYAVELREMNYTVIITSIAETELRTAFEYIHKDSPRSAQRWLQTLYDKITTLEKFPERCAIAPDSAFVGEELRHLVFKSHRVIFRVERSRGAVCVLGIRHGARLFIGEQPVEQDDAA